MDLFQSQSERKYKKIPIPDRLKDWLDFQKQYTIPMGKDVCREQMALHRAAEQFGIVINEKCSHNALYDAQITTELLIMFLTGEYRKQDCGKELQQPLYQFQAQPEFA